jgi:hypothetical protein
MPRSWSFAHDRRVIELAKGGLSLEEAARNMDRPPARIQQVAIRLGVSFQPAAKPKQKLEPNNSQLKGSAGEWISTRSHSPGSK